MSQIVNSALDRSSLGSLDLISDKGGQGIVYDVPAVQSAGPLVYKEYRPAILPGLDGAALSSMPQFLLALASADGRRLSEIAAWPCAVVEHGGVVIGFLMPRIRPEFMLAWTARSGVTQRTAELQHLLNHPDFLYERGHVVSLPQRLALISSIASNLAFLHRIGVVVGDVSPKNLLFSINDDDASSFFIDTDSMIVQGRVALPPVETPDWSVPAGEPSATKASDAYKMALAALRLLAADQTVKSPSSIPAFVPSLLRQIITDTLTATAASRPTMSAWEYVCGKV